MKWFLQQQNRTNLSTIFYVSSHQREKNLTKYRKKNERKNNNSICSLCTKMHPTTDSEKEMENENDSIDKEKYIYY